jgi:hypothetical protein
VALDSEWKPNIYKYDSCPMSIFQVGTSTHVYILDINALGSAARDWIAALLADESIIKVGLGFTNDLSQLEYTFPGFPDKMTFRNIFDISEYDRRGLAKLCAAELGVEM